MKRFWFITVIIMLLLASAVFASDALVIDSVKVKVDGDKESHADESGGRIEVKPGSEIEMEIKIKNTFPDDDDPAIEDIALVATLENIDDGDDLEEEADEFDLDPGDSKRITIKFQVPLKVDEDIFTLTLEIDGEDDNGTDHSIDVDYDVEVKKDRHALIFTDIAFTPSPVECNRNVNLDFGIVNIGREDEDDTKIEVVSSSFDYYVMDTFDFDSNIDDDNVEYSDTRSIDTTGKRPGVYEFLIKATYGSNILQQTKTLTIGACDSDETEEPTTAPTQPVQPQTPEEEEETSTTTSTGSKQADVVFQYTQPAQQPRYVVTDSKKSSSDDGKWIMIIIATDIVLVVVGILIYLAFRRKRR